MKRLKTFSRSFGSLLLVLLLLLSSSCWADVVLTDQEYQILDQQLEKAETLQKNSAEKINNLENKLTLAESDLTKAKKLQESSEKKIQNLETRLATAEKSYEKQKKDQKIKLIKYTITAFVVGTATGIVVDRIIK